MSDESLIQRLNAVINEEWYGGLPPQSPEPNEFWEAWILTALRRWRSFDRRNKVKHPTLEHRIEDLAKGLYGPDDPLNAPMYRYRDLARAMAEVLRDAQ